MKFVVMVVYSVTLCGGVVGLKKWKKERAIATKDVLVGEGKDNSLVFAFLVVSYN